MDIIFKRRSVRKYSEAPITDEQVKQIIKAGMAAPSAKNSQEWVFIVIRDKSIFEAFLSVHPNAFALKSASKNSPTVSGSFSTFGSSLLPQATVPKTMIATNNKAITFFMFIVSSFCYTLMGLL